MFRSSRQQYDQALRGEEKRQQHIDQRLNALPFSLWLFAVMMAGASGPVVHGVRATSAADITLPQADLYLIEVRAVGGTTPGSFSWLFDGASTAHFPSPSNATRGFAQYDMSVQLKGTLIPSAVQGFNGGISAVELLFSDSPLTEGKAFADHRAIRFARTDAGAVTGDVTVNFAGGAQSPKWVVVYQSASAGRVIFPASGGLTGRCEAIVTDRKLNAVKAPGLPPTASLTLSVITDAAATINGYVYY